MLQSKLSDATSYEERATLRQALRKRKKGRGESTAQSKPRGNSVYNRFAGSTATKSKAPAKSASDGAQAARSVCIIMYTVCDCLKLFVVHATLALLTYDPFHSLSYICLQVVPNTKPKKEVQEAPDQQPTKIVTPIPTPTPPPTPDPSVEEATEAYDEEADGTPVTTEPVEDENPYDGGETDVTPVANNSAVDEQEDIPLETTQENIDDQPGLSINKTLCSLSVQFGRGLKCYYHVGTEEEELTVSTKHGHASVCKCQVLMIFNVFILMQDNLGLSMDSTDTGSKLTTEPIGSGANLHRHLVAYVNQELFLDPPLPSRGKALFDTCSDPTSLWLVIIIPYGVVGKILSLVNYSKLINKCVSGTVDMRALSKVSGSSSQRSEAVQDNMTLAIESARAIGCHIDDSTAENILHKDPETINKFLLDLIRVSSLKIILFETLLCSSGSCGAHARNGR